MKLVNHTKDLAKLTDWVEKGNPNAKKKNSNKRKIGQIIVAG